MDGTTPPDDSAVSGLTSDQLESQITALAGEMLVKALTAALEEVPKRDTNVALAETQPLSFQARRAMRWGTSPRVT